MVEPWHIRVDGGEQRRAKLAPHRPVDPLSGHGRRQEWTLMTIPILKGFIIGICKRARKDAGLMQPLDPLKCETLLVKVDTFEGEKH